MKQQKCTKLWMWRYFHILATLENDIFFRIKSVILDSFLITISKIEKPKAIWPINFHSYTQCQFNFLAIISAMHPKSEWNDHIKILIFGGYETVQMTEPGPELPLCGGGGRVRGGDGGRGGLLLHQSRGRGRALSATSHSVPTSPAARQQGIK